VKLSDADVLATALVYKTARLTTYDPFLLFIGKEYITPEKGLSVYAGNALPVEVDIL
jgi:hypothetical protein